MNEEGFWPINRIYNISADPAKQNWTLWNLQFLIDSGNDLTQLGFRDQIPGGRWSDDEYKVFAEIIIDIFQHQSETTLPTNEVPGATSAENSSQ